MTEFFCDYLRMFEIAKNMNEKNFNRCIVIIVVMNFHKNFSITKIFPSRSPGIFANIFQCKIIPVYSICVCMWIGIHTNQRAVQGLETATHGKSCLSNQVMFQLPYTAELATSISWVVLQYCMNRF